MSMISDLIDNLRKCAHEWSRSNLFELARMASDAADTIWQLRDDLQLAHEENAKLICLVKKLHRLAYFSDSMDMAEKASVMNQVNHIVCEMGIFDPETTSEHDSWESIISDATALGGKMGRRTTQIDDLVSRCRKLADKTCK